MTIFRNYATKDADDLSEEVVFYRSLLRDAQVRQYTWLRRQDVRTLAPGQTPFDIRHGDWTVAKFYYQSHTVRYQFEGRYRLRSLLFDKVDPTQLSGGKLVWDDCLTRFPAWFHEETSWTAFKPGAPQPRTTIPMFHQVIVEAEGGTPGSVFLDNDKTP